MKILVFTQKVNRKDPVLGFFHRWLEVLAQKFESVIVICLERGEYDLPPNVKIFSLGKEAGNTKFKYVLLFYQFILRFRKDYDNVFVHMNEEYVLLGGLFWRLFGKKVFFWRNHPSGTFLTRIAVALSNRVFCTSKYSFTARFKKTRLMPVGVDISTFFVKDENKRALSSILFLGRISPIKRPHILIEALGKISKNSITFSASFYGEALPKDAIYAASLRNEIEKLRIKDRIFFGGAKPNLETPEIYSTHDIFVNLSPSGMYDKTIFEAMACGCLVLTSNENLKGQIDDKFLFREADAFELEKKLSAILLMNAEEKAYHRGVFKTFAKKHSLAMLIDELSSSIKSL